MKPTQQDEPLTLEQCMSKVNLDYEVCCYTITTHIRYVKAAEMYASQFKYRCTELEMENARLLEAMGLSEAWPITDVLMKLIESSEYLLHINNYNQLGWEEVSHCTKVGRKMVTDIIQALNPNQ